MDGPDTAAAASAATADDVEHLRRALDEAEERYLRAPRRLRQLRRRAAREQETARQEGRRAALTPILPVLDTLERALAAGSTDPRLLRGRGRHASPLRPCPARRGRRTHRDGRAARSTPTSTRPSPPMPANGRKPGTVAREVRRGWRLGDALLRPAQVVVVAAAGGGRRSVAVKFRDYYEVLGVPRTATAEEIKRAYRQLARKHHPDLKPAAERAAAAERFKEINEANEVLSDPDKRVEYDALGPNWKSGMDFTPPPGAGRTPRTARASGRTSATSATSSPRSSGAARGGAGAGAHGSSFAGSDVEAELPVTLEELLRGGRRRLQLPGGRTIEVEIPRRRARRHGAAPRRAGRAGPQRRAAGRSLSCACDCCRTRATGWRATTWRWTCRCAPWQAVLGGEVKSRDSRRSGDAEGAARHPERASGCACAAAGCREPTASAGISTRSSASSSPSGRARPSARPTRRCGARPWPPADRPAPVRSRGDRI